MPPPPHHERYQLSEGPFLPEADGVGVFVIQLCGVVVHYIKNYLDACIVQPAWTQEQKGKSRGSVWAVLPRRS